MRSPTAAARPLYHGRDRRAGVAEGGFYSSTKVVLAAYFPEPGATDVNQAMNFASERAEPSSSSLSPGRSKGPAQVTVSYASPDSAASDPPQALPEEGWTRRPLNAPAGLSEASATRILLIEDHPLVRDGIRALVHQVDDIELLDSISGGTRAIRRVQELKPDVVVVDIELREANGLLLVQRLADTGLCRLVVLSDCEDRAYLQRSLDAGVSAYVSKRSAGEHLLQAIRIAANGGLYVDQALAHCLVNGPVVWTQNRGQQQPDSLSARETTVIRSLAFGYTTKEIAAQLGVTAKTVETYKARAREKLGIRSRAQFVRYAASMGWLSVT